MQVRGLSQPTFEALHDLVMGAVKRLERPLKTGMRTVGEEDEARAALGLLATIAINARRQAQIAADVLVMVRDMAPAPTGLPTSARTLLEQIDAAARGVSGPIGPGLVLVETDLHRGEERAP